MRGVSLLNHVYGAVVPRPSPSKLISRYVPRGATKHLALLFSGVRADFNLHTNRDEVILRCENPPGDADVFADATATNVRVRLGNLKLGYA